MNTPTRLSLGLALALALSACGRPAPPPASVGSPDAGWVGEPVAAGYGKLKVRKVYDYVGDRDGTPWAGFEENGDYNYPEPILGGWPVRVTPVDASGNPTGPAVDTTTLQEMSPTDGRYLELPAGRYRVEELAPSNTSGGGLWQRTGANATQDGATTPHGVTGALTVEVAAGTDEGTATVARFFGVCRVAGETQTYPAGAAADVAGAGPLCKPDFGPPPSATAYANPLRIQKPGGGLVESCADPSIIKAQEGDHTAWYMYCTTDPHNDTDREPGGALRFHLVSIARSTDLVNWTYLGDAFSSRPDWVAPDAGLWAPDIAYVNGRYHLYYTAPDTKAGGSAIGVATSAHPAGPWVDSGGPVVEPHRPPTCCENDKRWTFDPDVVEDASGGLWIYYGSYFGGLSVRRLSSDGLRSDASSQVEVAIPNRYEGANVLRRGGFYYLFASASNCCNGPLTGYSVFVGRSASPTGPFVDREGVSLNTARVGGTPALSLNGNRWVGPGHNAVFTDEAGQDWMLYHAIDRGNPYFAGSGINRRPALLDPLDWVSGWPTVRGGLWASDDSRPAPAAQPGQPNRHAPEFATPDLPGALLPAFSDEFDGPSLDPRWSWVREPGDGVYWLEGGAFRFNTQDADLFEDRDDASVLLGAAPLGDYLVEAKVRLDLPADGCCFNFRQAGLVVYGDDDNYLRLSHVSIFETRQTEFAKEVGTVPPGFPRFGGTLVGPPDETTWLRVARRASGGEERYTAYTSRDGTTWVRGGTWTHSLGAGARIGLVSMGGPGFAASFDFVRVYSLGR